MNHTSGLGLPSPAEYAAAVLVLLAKQQGQWCILLEVRSRAVSQPGEICLPGGRAKPGETPPQTALRETQEELGIPADSITLLGQLPWQETRSGQPVAVCVGTAQGVQPQGCPQEVVGFFWLPLGWLRRTPPRCYRWQGAPPPTLPPVLRGYLQSYPDVSETLYWEYEGHGIWGLTARILQTAAHLADS